jgi:hypothetical protein
MSKKRSTAQDARRRSRFNPLHIMVAVLSLRERNGWIHPRLMAELARMALGAGSRYQMTYVPMHGVYPVSAARNRIVEQHFLPSAADWLCMFDNDIGPPDNVVEMILTAPAEADIVILPYWVWCSELHPMLCFGDLRMVDGQPQMHPQTYKTLGWQEGGAGGTGAIFIRRRAFEKVKKPYFKFIYDDNDEQVLGEDIYFTANARESGCRIFTNLDRFCSHYRTIDLAEVNVGVNSVLRRYVRIAQEKYGEHGIALPSLAEMLAMEKKDG